MTPDVKGTMAAWADHNTEFCKMSKTVWEICVPNNRIRSRHAMQAHSNDYLTKNK